MPEGWENKSLCSSTVERTTDNREIQVRFLVEGPETLFSGEGQWLQPTRTRVRFSLGSPKDLNVNNR